MRTSRGHAFKRRQGDVDATVFYVDGAVYRAKTQDERSRLSRAVPPRTKRASVLSQSDRWNVARECMAQDPVLHTVVSEIQQSFDVRFCIDASITETLMEISPRDSVCDLARAVGRRVITDDLVCYMSATYRRFAVWSYVLGAVPVCYIYRDATGDPSRAARFTREQVARTAESQADVFESLGGAARGDDFASALKRLGRGSNAVFRDIVYKMRNVEEETGDPREAEHVALTVLETLKFFKDGHVLYVPELTPDETTVLYDHDARAFAMVDERGVVYREFVVTKAPTMRRHPNGADAVSVHFESVVCEGAPESKIIRAMKTGFLSSALVNAKRSVVVGPGSSGVETDKRNDKLREFAVELAERYPSQIYNEFTRSAQNRDMQQRAGVAAAMMGNHRIDPAAINGPNPGVGGQPRAYGPGHFDLLENFEGQLRDGVLDEFRAMLGSYKTSSDCYRHLTDFLTAARNGEPDVMTKYARLTQADKDFVAPLVGLVDADTAGNRPEIHKLTEDTKLLTMFNATAGLSDVEELYHLWGSLWETKFTGANLYTRRTNAVKYEGNKGSADHVRAHASTVLVTLFCAAANAPGKLLTVVPHKHMTVVDATLVLDKLRDTTGVRNMLSRTLGVRPSSFKRRRTGENVDARAPPPPLN